MLKRLSSKQEKILFILIFLLIFLSFNATNPNSNLNFANQIFNFNSGSFISSILKIIINFISYLVCGLILFFVFIYFSDLIKAKSLRRVVKFSSLIILIGGFLVLTNEIVAFDFNIQAPNQTSSTTSASSITTSLPESSNFNFSTGTIPQYLSNGTVSQNTNTQDNLFEPSIDPNIVNAVVFLTISFIILLFARSVRIRKEKGLIETTSVVRKSFEEQDKTRKEIIDKYLKVSAILEQEGINADFSLTPHEFENETIKNLQFDEIVTITYYYELVRFSRSTISNTQLHEFDEAFNSILEKLSYLNVQKEESA